MQASPELGGLLHTIRAALRSWLIKMGLVPPPDEFSDSEKQLTEEQSKAQLDLRFHKQRRSWNW